MAYQVLNRSVLLVLAFISCFNIENAKSENDIGRVERFSHSFSKAVENSPRLLQIFDIKMSSFEISRIMFEESWAALEKAGVPYPQSSAKAVADALLVTVNFMSQDFYISSLGYNIATFLLSQTVLTPDNAADQGKNLADAILTRYPENVVNHSTLIRAICIGVADFLIAAGDFLPQTKPYQPLSLAEHYYAATVIPEPNTAVSVITNDNVIPPATDVYGITSFSSTFLGAVDSSALLQGIFNVDLPSSTVIDAWTAAASASCVSVNCYDPIGFQNRTNISVSQTYKYLKGSTFVKAISKAYALTLIGMGALSGSNAESSAQTLIDQLQTQLKSFPSDADLETRLSVVYKAIESFIPTGNNAFYQYSALNHNLYVALFAASPVQYVRL